MNSYERYAPIRVPIQMSFLESAGKNLVPTTAFDIIPKVRWRKIQEFCIWVLRKTKALHPHFDEHMLVREHIIPRDKATSEIIRMALPQLQMLGHAPERIYIGRSEMKSLMSEPPDYGLPWGFEIQGTRDMKIFNIPITVIPWMEGVLVV